MIETEAIFPVMVTKNLDTIKLFYEEVFGFNAVFYEPDFYLHLVLPKSGAQLGFLMPGQNSQPEFLHAVMPVDGYVITLEVNDAVVALNEAKRLGLKVVMALKEETWGQTHFMLEDPEGFRLDIVQHVGESR